MDFIKIKTKEMKDGTVLVSSVPIIGPSKDIVTRSGEFHAVYDPETHLWTESEYRFVELVRDYQLGFIQAQRSEVTYINQDPSDFSNGMWSMYRRYFSEIRSTNHKMDQKLVFKSDVVRRDDYATKRLSYDIVEGDCSAWDELVSVLYHPAERAKIEWALGAVVAGDISKIQKFLIFYGAPGTGKSTIFRIIEKLFKGYTTTFNAKALGKGDAFATAAFKSAPLVAIQDDGDLSKLTDNTLLNSIIAHEPIEINQKYRPTYMDTVEAMIMMGTNEPPNFTGSRSGLKRRVIDVSPTGQLIPPNHYNTLMKRIEDELGAIAYHCLQTYRSMGTNYYKAYEPTSMIQSSDHFYNFMEDHYGEFRDMEYVTGQQVYRMYRLYCESAGVTRYKQMHEVRTELRFYFEDFHFRYRTSDGSHPRNVYTGFKTEIFKHFEPDVEETVYPLVLEDTVSLFDAEYGDWPAQLANDIGNPKQAWSNVQTTLKDIDTSELHFVNLDPNHIVIDFDLKDVDGNKSLELNIAAASEYPSTYAEISKSGEGIHLHYIWDGDPSEISLDQGKNIEAKVFVGNASLRRKLTHCNNIAIATISDGLKLKEKKVINHDRMNSEKGLRELIARNLRKEIHPGTKPSVDFIAKIVKDAYESGMQYDITDMKNALVTFAMSSTNQADVCLRTVKDLPLKSEEVHVEAGECMCESCKSASKDALVIYDIEVYPNLFVVCWKFRGAPKETTVRMINPSPEEIEQLVTLRLVGFNNRRYDNHLLYARMLGYNNEALYKLSKAIIDGERSVFFGEAYNLSYADILDYSSKKQSLKKFQVELGLHHQEMDLPWDEPVPEEKWEEVVDYCVNDVVTTEAVMDSREQDFSARLILAELSGLSVNDTTQKHTARIIFGKDKNPQMKFVYTDLSEDFPGYVYDHGKSTYRGEDPSEGGYVYAEHGYYENVAVLDVASMHPTSIENLNLFGPYTQNYVDLKRARLAIKHGELEEARLLLGGKLASFIDSPSFDAEGLSYALKIVINIVYGLTSAKFENPFKDPRNKDNIVAKRGALFMIDLKHFVQERGFTVAHIKTDSIKIPNATPEIIEDVMAFGSKYGYDFEHEATYDKFCLVNDAVYIARKVSDQRSELDKYEAVGAQFQHPIVYKTLFTGEPLDLEDFFEAKSVQKGVMYLDFAWDRPMGLEPDMRHVGRTGLFAPVLENGAALYRVYEDKQFSVTGTKGYQWNEAANVTWEQIDRSYQDEKVDAAIKAIEKYVPIKVFLS